MPQLLSTELDHIDLLAVRDQKSRRCMWIMNQMQGAIRVLLVPLRDRLVLERVVGVLEDVSAMSCPSGISPTVLTGNTFAASKAAGGSTKRVSHLLLIEVTQIGVDMSSVCDRAILLSSSLD